MLARLPFLTIARLWTALVLATIGLQAMPAPAASVERTHGSAFASNTYEVALLVQRTDRSVRQAVAPQPLSSLAMLVETSQLRTTVQPSLQAPRPRSTGPPPYRIHSWKSAPRAPPQY